LSGLGVLIASGEKGCETTSAFDYRVGEQFTFKIATTRYVNAVTGTDWEGTGVVPEMLSSKEQALETADLPALRNFSKNSPIIHLSRTENEPASLSRYYSFRPWSSI